MNVIPPLAITDAMLTSSTAIETAPAAYVAGTTYASGDTVSVAGSLGALLCYTSLQAANTGNTPASSPTWWAYSCTTYPAYASGTTYALGYQVIDAVNHLVYQSLIAGNVGQALTDGTKWFLIGPTNKWAQFDRLRNTATVGASPMTTTITPGMRVDSIALLGLAATSVTITVTVSGSTVYTYTQSLSTRDATNAYDYCFKPFTTQQALALFDIPPYTNPVITYSLANTAGLVQCGGCFLGSKVYLGDIQYDAESDVLNFSTVTRDAQGNATMNPERNVSKTVQQIFLPKALVDQAYDLRDQLNGTTAIWCGINDSSDGYAKSFLIPGFYRRFTINAKYPDYAVIALELEEV